jgi:hypothetical protein
MSQIDLPRNDHAAWGPRGAVLASLGQMPLPFHANAYVTAFATDGRFTRVTGKAARCRGQASSARQRKDLLYLVSFEEPKLLRGSDQNGEWPVTSLCYGCTS